MLRWRITILQFAFVLVAACFALVCNGCGGGVGCTAQYVSGIVLRVVDAETGVSIADGAVATLRGNDYTETMRPYEYAGPRPGADPYDYSGFIPLSFAGAGERADKYIIRVQKDGYEPFEQTVQVTRDVCHVNQKDLTANLKRVAP